MTQAFDAFARSDGFAFFRSDALARGEGEGFFDSLLSVHVSDIVSFDAGSKTKQAWWFHYGDADTDVIRYTVRRWHQTETSGAANSQWVDYDTSADDDYTNYPEFTVSEEDGAAFLLSIAGQDPHIWPNAVDGIAGRMRFVSLESGDSAGAAPSLSLAADEWEASPGTVIEIPGGSSASPTANSSTDGTITYRWAENRKDTLDIDPGTKFVSTAAPVNVTVNGRGFTSGLTVKAGTTECTNVVVVSRTQLTCDTPVLVAGLYDLDISVGDESATESNYFDYEALSLTSCAPSEGNVGDSTTLSGEGMTDSMSLSIGGESVAFTFTSSRSVTFTIPAGLAAGAHDVIATEGAESDTLSSGYTVVVPPVVTITAPADSSSHGSGANINFTGTSIDNEDGDISSGIQWSSSIDGAMGVGASINFSPSDGTHIITAASFDSDFDIGTDQITITVG